MKHTPKIPFLDLRPMHQEINAEMQAAYQKVYDSNWFVLGEHLDEFERNFADFNQVKYSIGVSNGLDALFLSLKALNIKQGDSVVVPSNTFIATALAVSHTGATPVFSEPDINTYNITGESIRKAIRKDTKAVIPVHLYGQACKMDEIMRVAAKNNLFVVEDNAQAHGASFSSKPTGSFGQISATSFYPGKNLGALGDGGAVVTNNEALAQKVRILRNYGFSQKYHSQLIGYNMRLDELQAGFLNVKLRYIEKWTKQRQEIASWYNELLVDIGDLITPLVEKYSTHVYHLYVIRTSYRDQLMEHLQKFGIGTLIHYPIPPYLQPAYSALEYKKGDLPIAEELSETCLSLPLWPGLTRDEVKYVCEIIKIFFSNSSKTKI